MTTTANPSTWGWQTSGFAKPTLQNWIDYLLARAEYHTGVSIPRPPSDPIYLLLTTVADGLDTGVELVAETAAALDPVNSTGEALDTVGRFNGVTRLGAAPSTVLLRLSGSNGTVVPAGTRFADPSNTVVFATDAAATLTSSAGGGIYYDQVQATAIEDGPLVADTVTRIVNAIAGLSTVAIAPDEAVSPGRLQEDDADYAVRILTARFLVGKGTEAAITAALLQLAGVDAAVVYSNRSDAADSEGRPARSFEAVVWGSAGDPDDSLVGPAIIEQIVAGIGATFGDETWTQTDDDGVETSVSFTFATTSTVYVRYTIAAADELVLPADYAERMREVTVALINDLGIGDDVRVKSCEYAAVRAVPQLRAMTVETSTNGSTWVEADRAITLRAKAYIDPDDATTRVLVVVA